MAKIELQPEVLDLSLYSGDGFGVRFTCKDIVGAPIDINGAVSAQIRLDRLHPDDPPVMEFTIGLVDAYLGIILLTLNGEQTQELTEHPSTKAGKFTGIWDLEWDPSEGEPRTLCQGTVECVSDVTR